jgi:serine protease Do
MRSILLALAFCSAAALARADSPAPAAAAPPPAALGLPGFRDLARAVKPCVVNLSVVKNVKAGLGGDGDPFMQQFFGRFFGQQAPDGGERDQWFKQSSLGSGVIVDAQSGYILTNNHVVEGADDITVKLADKRELKASVVGRDPKTDLAVIKLKTAENLTAASFGDSDALEVGDWVLAIGSPFGLEQTVSHGIISAKGRVIGEGPYDDFLQTDAPINPGNSGGPLVNLAGEVVGINSAITSRSGGSEGIGFAIPSNLARSIYRQLVSTGKVVRGWLGVSIQDLDPALARHFGLAADAKGVLVADVLDHGPARDAGLRSGDVILKYNGKPVDASRDLQRRVAETAVGQSVSLGLWRDRGTVTVNLKVGNMDEADGAAGPDQGPSKAPRLGLQVHALAPEDARRRHLDHAVVVDAVEPGSAAEQAGVQPGDVVLEMDKSRIDSPEQLAGAAKRLKAGDAVILRVQRGGRSLYLTLQLGDDSN